MPELDKVINGLKACLKYPDKCTGDCTTDLCSYHGDCHTELLKDALALLEAQRPRVLTLEELSMGSDGNGRT